jgi:hypothetical protein
VFLKTKSGEVFHTYSTYARGGEPLIGTYHYLDLAPKGRDEGDSRFRCPGSGITIATTTTMGSIRIVRTSRQRG